MIRDFRITRDFNIPLKPGDVVERKLQDWNPDGMLVLLENDILEKLLQILPRAVPIVSMAALRSGPNIAVVTSSFPALCQCAVSHLRQQGFRSQALLLLESEPQMQTNLTDLFKQIVRPAHPARATHVECVHSDLIEDHSAPVTPIPKTLEAWLRSLPKPVGILCPHMGGGGYLIRVCNALGLRVPQDVGVIGMDDTDLSMATSPTLTSMVAVGEQIGSEAMRILTGMMAGKPAPAERVRVEGFDLQVRESTGLARMEICDIAGALDYINRHACEGLTVDQLIKATQRVSGMTFHKHFKKATKRTPGEAIRQRQFEEACRLLAETELPINSVAAESGFGGSSDFARRFRAMSGKTPSGYRQRARGG